MIPLMYLYVGYLWAIPFVLFYQANPWQALESSRQLISRKWFAVFGLVLVIIGITMFVSVPLGMVSSLSTYLAFVTNIGLGILNALVMCIFYAAFSEVTRPLETPDEEEDPIDHLIGD
jgi:surface polysaccharide O-acyltransferase-like enzyme